MGANSKIEWTDRTWNPVSGCTRASAGCDNCYAVTMTKRLEAMGQEKYAGLVNVGKGHFNGVVKCHEETLLDPLRWRKPQRVFVNSMSDLFHKDVPFEFIDKVFAVMALCPHLTFQVLTKRPERAAQYFALESRGELIWDAILEIVQMVPGGFDKLGLDPEEVSLSYSKCPDWVWIGTSVENQATADERIPHLLRIPAAVRFLSCEPLLGPVNAGLDVCWSCGACLVTGSCICDDPARIAWLICGGESGPNARPMHPDWARALRDQCQAAGVPFFFKQWGEYHPEPLARGPEVGVSPFGAIEGVRTRGLWPMDMCSMFRVGKARAGRLLDGQEWSQFPEVGL